MKHTAVWALFLTFSAVILFLTFEVPPPADRWLIWVSAGLGLAWLTAFIMTMAKGGNRFLAIRRRWSGLVFFLLTGPVILILFLSAVLNNAVNEEIYSLRGHALSASEKLEAFMYSYNHIEAMAGTIDDFSEWYSPATGSTYRYLDGFKGPIEDWDEEVAELEAMLTGITGFELRSRALTVTYYPDADSYRAANPGLYDRMSWEPGGIYSAGSGIHVYEDVKLDTSANHTFYHEYTHHFFHRIYDDTDLSAAIVPIWFEEGIAEFTADTILRSDPQELRNYDSFVPFNELEDWETVNHDHDGYLQVRTLIHFLFQQSGYEGIGRVLAGLKEENIADLIRDETGLALEEAHLVLDSGSHEEVEEAMFYDDLSERLAYLEGVYKEHGYSHALHNIANTYLDKGNYEKAYEVRQTYETQFLILNGGHYEELLLLSLLIGSDKAAHFHEQMADYLDRYNQEFYIQKLPFLEELLTAWEAEDSAAIIELLENDLQLYRYDMALAQHMLDAFQMDPDAEKRIKAFIKGYRF
ncbi:hypothetical protein CR205_12810 [Alteribacter lacisalsi]|uniref:DUF1570 domain-containing protein n=1 Tax=Alteribacter lacisalsi TaxID=2045244 RepID=A0A2W0HGN8_9BACI|nr:hypothetical protein [Alteribacter lacisalsi]PYZ96585.1 hypothetical protein CR205_12810 [Alteribacter lacisalsi]